MRSSFRPRARQDILEQMNYYLLESNSESLATRFRDQVQHSVEEICRHPDIGERRITGNAALTDLRSWPVKGFSAIRIYYLRSQDSVRIVRVLHGKQDVKELLAKDRGPF